MPKPLHEDTLTSLEKGDVIVRSISLPVAEYLSGTWQELNARLHECWGQATALANWASHELARRDCVRTPGMKELPPMSTVYLYGLAFGEKKKGTAPLYDGHDFWAGGKIAGSTLLRKVERKYRKERGKIVWRRERRSPEYLYPHPFPVHKQAWEAAFDEKNRPIVFIGLPGGRISLRLRGGDEFRRQLRIFRQLTKGEIEKSELSICRQRCGASHRREGSERSAGGGHHNSYRIMVRISVKLPKVKAEGGTAHVRTGAGPFLTVNVNGQEPWLLHAPWAFNWIVEHQRFLKMFSDDLKYEKRWPGKKRKNLNRYRERRCEKHARRMDSFLKQTAAQTVGYARRKGCAKLCFDDNDRSFVEPFPWERLYNAIQAKCDELGMVLEVASGLKVKEDEVVATVASND